VATERFEKGMAVRREVLGDEYVDRALAGVDDLTQRFQELVTEFAWGVGWSEGVLSRRERSLLTMAIVGALNRGAEMRIHIRAAVQNGCSREEIADALTQLTLYAGTPAGVDAFRIAGEVFAEIDSAQPDA
jgi:4-carboxymuconolactone decarboxylase